MCVYRVDLSAAGTVLRRMVTSLPSTHNGGTTVPGSSVSYLSPPPFTASLGAARERKTPATRRGARPSTMFSRFKKNDDGKKKDSVEGTAAPRSDAAMPKQPELDQLINEMLEKQGEPPHVRRPYPDVVRARSCLPLRVRDVISPSSRLHRCVRRFSSSTTARSGRCT